ncbi:MAG: hypothetical protein JXD22_11145 [Sedimentisphaerales bacterium]|nr:hypothetical protein [Sedimentisphaerales bacterium]
MSAISEVNNNLIQGQIASAQLRQQIDVKIAKKTLDAAEVQGEAVVSLLEDAVTFSKQANSASKPILTFGSLVSGLGQNLDVRA